MSRIELASLGVQRVQFAALPYRVKPNGKLEFLLVTSRETHRWVVPKGWPMKQRSPSDTAKREALEEAGVRGRISSKPIGQFSYAKRLSGDEALPCVVDVFSLRVKDERADWPEKPQRKRQWFTRQQAARRVQEPELRALLKAFEPPSRHKRAASRSK